MRYYTTAVAIFRMTKTTTADENLKKEKPSKSCHHILE